MQENLKKYMGNSENPKGTNIINNLTSTKYFLIAMAIKKYLCLASYSLYLFLERNELIEISLKINCFLIVILRQIYIIIITSIYKLILKILHFAKMLLFNELNKL